MEFFHKIQHLKKTCLAYFDRQTDRHTLNQNKRRLIYLMSTVCCQLIHSEGQTNRLRICSKDRLSLLITRCVFSFFMCGVKANKPAAGFYCHDKSQTFNRPVVINSSRHKLLSWTHCDTKTMNIHTTWNEILKKCVHHILKISLTTNQLSCIMSCLLLFFKCENEADQQ